MKTRSLIIGAVLGIAVIGGVIGYRMYDERTPDRESDKPDFVINATQLIAAFDNDTASASKQYVDKLLEVTGTVTKVDSTGSVELGKEESASAVTVSLDRRHINDYKKLKLGAVATIKGKCTGFSKGNGEDLIGSLGTTVELNFASVVEKQ